MEPRRVDTALQRCAPWCFAFTPISVQCAAVKKAEATKPGSDESPVFWMWLGLLGAVIVGNIWLNQAPNDDTVNRLQMGLALGAFGLLFWGYRLAQTGTPLFEQKSRDRMLVVLGVIGGLAYCNFARLHFSNFIHVWDTYHYYMGSKYFSELNYDLLYDCAVVADKEDGVKGVDDRVVTDLRTNVMVRVTNLLAHPDICTSHFTPERWAAFKKDVAFFRGRVAPDRWVQVHHDHGYNATPVWTLLGKALTNLGPATLNQVTALNLIDPLYLLAAALAMLWAFGWRGFALGLLMLGTNFPNRYYWTGGAYLRHDWLFYTVATVCLLKKDRPFLAGASLSYATLLRLFPGLMVVGPLLAGIEYLRVNRQLEPAFKRFVLGGIVGTAALLALSFTFVGGAETWAKFAANTQKHAATPLTNHMGLRTVLSYRFSTIGQVMRDGKQIDAWAKWKSTRLESFRELKPLFALLLLAGIALLYFAIRDDKPPLWVSASLGIGFIVFGAELTCYYYCFFMGMAALYERRREAGLLLLMMAAVTQIIHLTPFAGMSGWEDEQYFAMSVTSLIAVAAVWWSFTRWGTPNTIAAEGPVGLPLFAPVAATARGEPTKRKRKRG